MFGTPKKAWALTGHPGWTFPDVSSTSNCVLTPWRTKLVDAARPMSGGLQPGPKEEQVVADDDWPMKLALALLPPSSVLDAGESALVLSLCGASFASDAEASTP